jgi:hypothetical protein
LRLPLNSLPAISKFQREEPLERSPFEDLPALGDYNAVAESRYGSEAPDYVAPSKKAPKLRMTRK